jgi:putative transposase
MFRLNASKQLGHLFNSYAQSINKAHNRTGPLFESPFERKLVDNEDYLLAMIHYCHRNPVHHRFVDDLRDWEFSSYHSIITNDDSLVAVQEVIKRFGTTEKFEEAHGAFTFKKELERYIIEV